MVKLPLITDEEEQFILDDGAAHGCAVGLDGRLLLGISHRYEGVCGIQSGVTPESIGRSMNGVGAGFQANVDDGAGLPAIFSSGILLGVELLNRVNRQD